MPRPFTHQRLALQREDAARNSRWRRPWICAVGQQRVMGRAATEVTGSDAEHHVADAGDADGADRHLPVEQRHGEVELRAEGSRGRGVAN